MTSSSRLTLSPHPSPPPPRYWAVLGLVVYELQLAGVNAEIIQFGYERVFVGRRKISEIHDISDIVGDWPTSIGLHVIGNVCGLIRY
jgi:hypothetical protein